MHPMSDPTPQDNCDNELAILSLWLKNCATTRDPDEPFTEADIYAEDPIVGTQYLLSGGGPSSYAAVLTCGTDTMVVLSVVGWSVRSHEVITGRDAEQVAEMLKDAK